MTRKAHRHDLSVWFDGSEIAERDDTLIMQDVEHNGHEALTLLELLLPLNGEFRRSLEPIRVTTLQADVLLYLHRHREAKLNDTAATLGSQPPTVNAVMKDLLRKRWVSTRRSITDSRAVCLSLSRRGAALALQSEHQVRHVRLR